MAVDDSAAHDLAAACLKAGIGVPDHVAIMGVNNDDLLCDSAWPPLSSVDCDYSRVGYIAAGMLDRLLKDEKLPKAEREVRLAPLGVVRRQSTDLLAVDEPEVADAVRYIREHACDPCSVGDVLRHVPVGRRWLERQFMKKLGRNPHDEIMRVRIETAKRLLLQPELTLPDIAERCGFAANQNLGRAFRDATGVTPGVYRRAAIRGAR
jgi:LacI family transcriptional regulator